MVRLQAHALVLDIAPDVGGAISAFYSQLPGEPPTHWLRPASPQALQQADPLGMASFALVPWCNRIRCGRAQALGEPLALPPDPLSPHAIHGLGWRRPWRLLAASDTQARLALAHDGGAGWPWPFEAEQTLTLRPDGLDVCLRLCNHSPRPMPYGLGHHPYFPHLPGTRLACRVQAMWANDAERLPTALVQPDFLPRMAQGLALAELDLDHNFIGWDRRCTLTWPGRRQQLVLRAEPPLDFFVLYCPRGRDHFCAEPVSNCTDWLNLLPQHAPGEVGGGVLAPGQCTEAQWSIDLEPVAALGDGGHAAHG